MAHQQCNDLWEIAAKHVAECESYSIELNQRRFETWSVFYRLLLSLCVKTRRAFASIAVASFFKCTSNMDPEKVLKDFMFVIDRALAVAEKFCTDLSANTDELARAETFCRSIRFRHDAIVVLIGLGQFDFLEFLKKEMRDHLNRRIGKVSSSNPDTVDLRLLKLLDDLQLEWLAPPTVAQSTAAGLLVWATELNHEVGPYGDALKQHAAIGLETFNAAQAMAGQLDSAELARVVGDLRKNLVDPLADFYQVAVSPKDDSETTAKTLMAGWTSKVVASALFILAPLGSSLSPIAEAHSPALPQISENAQERNSNTEGNKAAISAPKKSDETQIQRRVNSKILDGLYVPSTELVQHILRSQVSYTLGTQYDNDGVTEEVTNDIEGLFESLALAVGDESNEPNPELKLTDDEGFLIEPVSRELASLWDLKICHQSAVLSELTHELRQLAENRANRRWGYLELKSGALVMRIQKGQIG